MSQGQPTAVELTMLERALRAYAIVCSDRGHEMYSNVCERLANQAAQQYAERYGSEEVSG